MSWDLQEYINKDIKDKCPITGGKLYKIVYHPELDKLIPTYSIQAEKESVRSQTIPVLTPNGEGFVIQHFNHETEEWEEPVLLHTEQMLLSLILKSRGVLNSLKLSLMWDSKLTPHEKQQIEEAKLLIEAADYLEEIYR